MALPSSYHDTSFVDGINDAIGPNANARFRQLASSLTRHLHEFCKENRLTLNELEATVSFVDDKLNRAGQERNFDALGGILGLETLVDDITHNQVNGSNGGEESPEDFASLGPMWRKNAPERSYGDSIAEPSFDNGERLFLHGTVTDAESGLPIAGAELDIWQAAPNGLYENQDEQQPEWNLRGRFRSDAQGRYAFYCLRPTPYAFPLRPTTVELLGYLDRHGNRAAHIHTIVRSPGYKLVVGELYDRTDRYLSTDAVFKVTEDMVLDLKPLDDDPNAKLKSQYDFKLRKR